MITRRTLFKSIAAGLAALVLAGTNRTEKVYKRYGTEFVCDMPEGCERLCVFNDTIYTHSDTTVYYLKDNEFIEVNSLIGEQTC